MATREDGHDLKDKFLGKVKTVVGSALRDDDLKSEGALHQRKADAVAEAVDTEKAAERREAEADVIARQQQLEAESQRLAAEEAAAREADRIERQRDSQEALIEAEAEQRQSALHHVVDTERAMIDQAAMEAAGQRQVAEQAATLLEQHAAQAKRAAQQVDESAGPGPRRDR